MIRKIFAQNFKLLKQNSNMTIKELSSKIGYSCSTIKKWYIGQLFPSAEAIDSICGLFQITPSELFKI